MPHLSEIYGHAVHVFPLHLWKPIVEAAQLLSADDRAERGLSVNRPSSAETDALLGVTGFVPLYLTHTDGWRRPDSTLLTRVKILTAKMVKRKPPFPHAVLSFDTSKLGASGTFISCWNASFGKPGKGTWAKETPEERLAFWQQFVADNKQDRKKLKGFVSSKTGIQIPVYRPTDIASSKTFIKQNARELMVPSPLAIADHAPRLFVFSREDFDLVSAIPRGANIPRPTLATLDGYDPAKVDPEIREQIKEYFENGGDIPELEYD